MIDKTKLTNTVKFDVILFKIYTGEAWTQEFIKPLFNDKGAIETRYLFNSAVIETINTYGCEMGIGYELTMFDIDSRVMEVNIGVSPYSPYDYANEGYEDGYFNFYKDRRYNTEVWREVDAILNKRKDEICMEGIDFSTTPKIREVA
jgi:hypothetical protein